eukprot:TRINITY_DN4501_c0_g1_i2.p1 TRINITY_DN4501_c0_g1~~TRINITY_DN4501_c0_g1_i2.p1  ORF type:complete len:784 (+),score=160.40 TRINITY_DN4501_c0_g1_i2:62-2413(+)
MDKPTSASGDAHKAQDIFNQWDVNDSGLINVQDLKKVIKALVPSFTEADLDDLLYHKEEGTVSYEAFLDWMYDNDGLPKIVQELSGMVGRAGVSRLYMKNDATGGSRDITAFMASSEPCPKKVIHAQDSNAPMHAMHFWNVNGSKVYSYAGLESLADVKEGDTGIGILMLDRYAIQERVGDPASPFTWWPYQAFYVIPKGVDFAVCKKVGAHGPDAVTQLPSETRTICNALTSLVEVALSEGKTRCFITADCGYYALGIESYLALLPNMGWERTADACFCAPSFRYQNKVDVTLCLGTTQMISTPDPRKNILSRCEDCRVFYGTADLRGWYGGDVRNELDKVYPTDQKMNTVLRANEGLLWGMVVADTEESKQYHVYLDIVEILMEFTAGSIAFLLGMYVGMHTKVTGASTMAEAALQQWNSVPTEGRKLLEALGKDYEGFKKFCEPIGLACFKKGCKDNIFRKGEAVNIEALTTKDIKHEEWLAVFIYLCGIKRKLPKTEAEQWHYFYERFVKDIDELLNFDEEAIDIPGYSETVILGPRYVEWYCKFNVYLNRGICKKAFDAKKVNHAVDGEQIFLLDCKFIPGFGKQVADGLTVWCYSPFYWWLSYVYAGFVGLVNKDVGSKPMVYHLECTELFNFTDFLQQNGCPVLDNPNYVTLASLGTGRPLQFEAFPTHDAPAALMFFGEQWYRDSDIKLRTPKFDGGHFRMHMDVVFPPGRKGLPGEVWEQVDKACFKFKGETLGIGQDKRMYVASTEIVSAYVGEPRDFDKECWKCKGSVDYSP